MSARVFLFSDNIDTDALAPGAYMRGTLADLAAHCLESVDPSFARTVRQGDIVVAGRNFGMGSSREQAVQALKHLGVGGVVAISFAGIFYRNAINLGLPVLTCRDVSSVEDGDAAELVLDKGLLQLPAKKIALPLDPLPGFLRDLLSDGGLVPHLKKKFAESARRTKEQSATRSALQ